MFKKSKYSANFSQNIRGKCDENNKEDAKEPQYTSDKDCLIIFISQARLKFRCSLYFHKIHDASRLEIMKKIKKEPTDIGNKHCLIDCNSHAMLKIRCILDYSNSVQYI